MAQLGCFNSLMGQPSLSSYTLATAPTAATGLTGWLILITDDFEDNIPCYCDGTVWRRIIDNEQVG